MCISVQHLHFIYILDSLSYKITRSLVQAHCTRHLHARQTSTMYKITKSMTLFSGGLISHYNNTTCSVPSSYHSPPNLWPSQITYIPQKLQRKLHPNISFTNVQQNAKNNSRSFHRRRHTVESGYNRVIFPIKYPWENNRITGDP